MSDEPGGSSSLRWVSVAGVIVLLLLTMALLMVVGVNPCKEDLAAETPQVGYNVSYDPPTHKLTVVHEAGDRLTARNSNAVTVRLFREGTARLRDDGPDDESNRYVLASDATAGFPLEPSDRWTFQNVTIDGRRLTAGDVILVVWRGPGEAVPQYCPNHGEDTEVFARHVVGSGE